jgi:hypothetical protein
MSNPAGLELEFKFCEWILSMTDELGIDAVDWLSQESKASEFDFVAYGEDRSYYLDVVGYYPFRDTYRLNTSHKSWHRKLGWLKEFGWRDYVGALAFSFDNGTRWRFLKIHNKLPDGDLLLTEERRKNMMTAGWFFGVHGHNMTELKEWGWSQAEDRAEDLKLMNNEQMQELYNELLNEWVSFNKI